MAKLTEIELKVLNEYCEEPRTPNGMFGAVGLTKEELKKLYKEEELLRVKFNENLKDYIESLVTEVKNKKLDEKQLRERLSELMNGTKDIIPLYRVLLEEAERQKVKLDSILIGLAERLIEEAKKSFLAVPQNELSEAATLFEKSGMKKEAQKCKDLIETMFAIAEDNEIKI